ncbi:MAG: DUF2059 domain-containing protein [Maritimibacter sp.]|nr:DUF2059 domain-containing protein [Maritimibacter sp.]
MRLISSAALALALMLSQPAAGQDAAALARQYAEMPEVQAMFDDMFAPEMLAEQFRFGLPAEVQLSDDQIARVGDVMAEMMASLRPDLTQMMVDGMAANFTIGEIEALIAFYGSPDGASVMRKMQPYMQQVLGAFMPLIQQRQQEFLPDLIAIIQE